MAEVLGVSGLGKRVLFIKLNSSNFCKLQDNKNWCIAEHGQQILAMKGECSGKQIFFINMVKIFEMGVKMHKASATPFDYAEHINYFLCTCR